MRNGLLGRIVHCAAFCDGLLNLEVLARKWCDSNQITFWLLNLGKSRLPILCVGHKCGNGCFKGGKMQFHFCRMNVKCFSVWNMLLPAIYKKPFFCSGCHCAWSATVESLRFNSGLPSFLKERVLSWTMNRMHLIWGMLMEWLVAFYIMRISFEGFYNSEKFVVININLPCIEM